MSNTKLQCMIGSILIGAALMAAAATSNAAVFRGSWDPTFGGPYPNLGWRGFVDIFVPDPCLETETAAWFASGSCGDEDMSLLAATVELYDANIGPSAQTDIVYFATPVVPDPVIGVFIAFSEETGRNEVTALDTDIFGPEFGTGPGYSGNLWLEFISGQMPVFSLLTTLDAPPNGAFLHACLPDSGEASFCESPETTSTIPGIVTFQRIPEPGSVALIFGALAAGWLVRRQVRNA